jgi:hypothetical protein
MFTKHNNNQAGMQFIQAEKKEKIGVTAFLNNMEISNSIALQINQEDVDTARSIIGRIHRETSLRFTTKKTGTGINVWRIA